MTNEQRIAEIKARCDDGRPIRRIDIKYLLSQLPERDKEIERLREAHIKVQYGDRELSISEMCAEMDRMKDMIHRQKDAIDRLSNRSWRWIPVSERLPEAYIPVLVYRVHSYCDNDGYGDIRITARTSVINGNVADWMETGNTYIVTHWMPIPDAPKGAEHE